jgi:LPXTG-site transpeptidase (sortase) family protein
MKLGSDKPGRQEAVNLILGPDPPTTLLVWLAFILAAAIAALGVDLYRWPAQDTPVAQVSVTRGPPRTAIASPVEPTPRPQPTPTPTPTLTPTPAPAPSPSPTPVPGPVRIRIPAIGVDRSIVEVPLAYDARSHSWQRDYDRLFRRGKPDLVGHIDSSASPGQPGNTILVGHNYGYGVTGVFLRLGRLKEGQQVQIVNSVGQSFAYQVTDVMSVRWTKKSQQELLSHQSYLAVEGAERLTLVTCGGSSWAPFPNRVYVVAVPARSTR